MPQAKPTYSQRERDFVLRNSELSFQVRRLEEINTALRQERQELVRASLGPRGCWLSIIIPSSTAREGAGIGVLPAADEGAQPETDPEDQ